MPGSACYPRFIRNGLATAGLFLVQLSSIACGPPAERAEDPDPDQSESQPGYFGVVTYQQTTSLTETYKMPQLDPTLSGGSMRVESRQEIVTVRIAPGRGTSMVNLRESKHRQEHMKGTMACSPAEAPHPVTGENAVDEEATASGTGEGSVEVSPIPEEARYEGIVSWTVAAPGKSSRRTRGSSSGDCDHVDVAPTSDSEEFTHEGGSAALAGPWAANTTVLSGSTTTPTENGETLVTWYLAPKSRCTAESLMVKEQAQRLDRRKDKAYRALVAAHQALPKAMDAALKPPPDGSLATSLSRDFTEVQLMLMELETRYRGGTGKAAAGDLTAEVDPLSRQFVKDLEVNVTKRVTPQVAYIGVYSRIESRPRSGVDPFLILMRELWEESVRASSTLEALEQAKQALRDCLAGVR